MGAVLCSRMGAFLGAHPEKTERGIEQVPTGLTGLLPEELARRHDELKVQYQTTLSATLNAKPMNHFRRILTAAAGAGDESGSGSGVSISLLPHEHSLFCERKQRVCTSVGKLQEHEKLRINSKLVDLRSKDVSIMWLRSPPGVFSGPQDASNDEGIIDDTSKFTVIDGTQGKLEYELGVDDVDCYISVRIVYAGQEVEGTVMEKEIEAEAAMGPVLAGPPRLLDLTIEGSPLLELGSEAVATINYIGGKPGASEFWWLRIRGDGEREQLGEPRTIRACDAELGPAEMGKDDPRIHLITPEDMGCVLKVKCRPVRIDGHKGEIFTSKPTKTINPGGVGGGALSVADVSLQPNSSAI